ncbi:MAG: Gx transporter family protein [Bacillota bacterium]
MNARRLSRLALFIAMGAILHWVEGTLPAPVPIPGAKLGLANLITLLAVVMWGVRDALVVAVGRALLGSLLGGTFGTLAFFMSTGGAVSAALIMSLASLSPIGPVGLSVIGAATHNVAQLFIFYGVTGYPGVWIYLPPLLGLAAPAGAATGTAGGYLLARIRHLAVFNDSDRKTPGS